MTIQVTLIGGPADLQRHVVDNRMNHICVASMNPLPARPYCGGEPLHNLTLTTHTYDIRQIDRDVYLGLWTGRYG